MYAVIESGGKQHRVIEGETLKLEKIEAATGETIEFDKVLMIGGEEIKIGTEQETGAVLGVTFGLGAGLLGLGIPIASTGTFTTKQMNRTIKGAEKVPRTVANETRYWDYYGQRQAGQALTVSGGGAGSTRAARRARSAAILFPATLTQSSNYINIEIGYSALKIQHESPRPACINMASCLN